MHMIRTTLAAAALALAAVGASAQTSTPRTDARQNHQDTRIDRGEPSGALTGREELRLRAEQDEIARAEARAKADGVVTPAEQQELNRMQNAAGRDIRHQKHDAQVGR